MINKDNIIKDYINKDYENKIIKVFYDISGFFNDKEKVFIDSHEKTLNYCKTI